MIIAEQKSLDEIREMIAPYKKLLVLGCGTCVTVCFAGGEKEVEVLASALRLADRIDGGEKVLEEKTIKRQCDPEYLEEIREKVKEVDAVLSLACGVGVGSIADEFPSVKVLPGLNTLMFGRNVEAGVWAERCGGCGNCVLHLTGGICPIARCSKSMLNGPCGGSQYGKCEVSPNIDCAWQLIIDHLDTLGEIDNLEKIQPPKDWRTAYGSGPRTVIREDLKKL
ncbi:MAG: hypothetical protein EPO21_22425 [Chloroflexota bacterium]|nr:MAG: hypothetical protein EPO21_22425 [Chloroflexota bacterium]